MIKMMNLFHKMNGSQTSHCVAGYPFVTYFVAYFVAISCVFSCYFCLTSLSTLRRARWHWVAGSLTTSLSAAPGFRCESTPWTLTLEGRHGVTDVTVTPGDENRWNNYWNIMEYGWENEEGRIVVHKTTTTADFDSSSLFCVSFCQDCRRGERPRQDHQAGLIIRRQYQHESKVPARLDETWWHDETHFFVTHVMSAMSVMSTIQSHHTWNAGIASRFANFEKFERAKRWQRRAFFHETSNIQRPIPGHFSSFFHVFSTFGCAVLWRTTGSGMGWPTIRSGTENLRDTLGAVTLQKHVI